MQTSFYAFIFILLLAPLTKAQTCGSVFQFVGIHAPSVTSEVAIYLKLNLPKASRENLIIEKVPLELSKPKSAANQEYMAIVTESKFWGLFKKRSVIHIVERNGISEIQLRRDKEAFYVANELTKIRLEKVESSQREYLNRDLRSIPRSRNSANVLNKATLEILKSEFLPPARDRRIQEVPFEGMQEIFNRVSENAVASEASYAKYAGSGDPGLCWGRAMTVHIEALRSGVAKESIKKIWIAGDLWNGSSKWVYHVSTILRGADGQWYTIDPVFGKVMTVDAWYAEMKTMDSGGDARIYITSPSRYGPGSEKKYSAELSDPTGSHNTTFNGYFSDLLALFKSESRELVIKARNSK